MNSSHSLEAIHRSLAKLAEQGRDCLLAVVLQSDGSTPCKAGSKAIMDAAGVIQGTIGGGLVEAETQRRAAESIETGRPVVLDFNLDSGAVAGSHPICGGSMRVLMDPTALRHQEAYATAAAIQRSRGRGVLLTTIRGPKLWDVAVECLAEEAIPPELPFPGSETVRSALERAQPDLFLSQSPPEGQCLEVLVEPLIPNPVVLVVGGGHVGQAVAAQAAMVGFDIVVIDDRPEFTRAELFPEGATMRCGNIVEEIARFPLRDDTYVVIVTRGHKHDAEALAACIHEPAACIGMIGSRRKVAMMRHDFIESGRAAAAEFDRVYAPIGLDIGSVTVPEIATSIVAQLIAVRRSGISPRIPGR
ncbi:MAG TPA: XdhC family protein [Thermoguttaceae bacterium]|nr:XdhC family protein [Thermoguttaceae bacterium]